MFRKYPYWGWLVLSLLLWCFIEVHFYSHRQKMLPERMARVVNEDLHHTESDFNRFINQGSLIRKIFSDSLSEKESDELYKLPFFIYVYHKDSLQFWNTNKVIGTFIDSLAGKPFLLHNEKGVFIEKCIEIPYNDNYKRLVFLFPVCITYPLENDYLKSHFVASDYIPVKTKIVSDSSQGGQYAVTMLDGKAVLYLHFNPEDIQKWVPDPAYLVMLFIAIITSILWIQLLILHYTRNRSAKAGVACTLVTVLILRFAIYIFGLPFNLETLAFFTPHLFSYGWLATSMGDLFINIMFLLWIIVFITRHTPYKTYFSALKHKVLRYAIAIILMLVLTAFVFLLISVIKSLVLSPNLSFDVSHFSAINIFTIYGLLAIAGLTGITCMVIYLFNMQFSLLLKNKTVKYILLALMGFVWLMIICKTDDVFSWTVNSWLLLFVVLLDIRNFTIVSDLFEPHMIFWAVFICGFSTLVIHYFNQLKEKGERKNFVDQRLSPRRDTVMENAFDKSARLMLRDKPLKNFMVYPTLSGRKSINQHLETQYFTGILNQYQSKIFIFDENGESLYNKDTTDYESLIDEKNESAATNSEYLFYKESILDHHYYLSYFPVYADSSVNLLGYIIINLELKKRVTETVYPELLQPIANKASESDNEYAYAVYINDKLITQTKDYPFTVTLNNDTLKEQQYAFYSIAGITELHYKISDKRIVVVVHFHSEIIETITLFSYLFGIQVLLAVLILAYRVFLSYFTGALFKIRFLNLRRRVHFSMLAVILLSFIIIGSVTILFFTMEYKASNSNKLQSAMQVVKQSVQEYLKRENAFETENVFDSISRSTRFKYFITGLANDQKIDINIFDEKGNLFSSSQDEIYEKGLISRKIRPDAFYRLNNEGKSLIIRDEQVAGLSYLSAYQPLRDEDGVTLGYIGVPFFSSEKDLNFQISNIVVTLINLYAFIFLISSVITVVITRWIVRIFNIITRQFERLNLQKNERLKWPYNDEIGTLVSEYNKMVQKVEENAILLVQSERESAWREMARQVAHEIKNPLTPMKLNIQYLQQAIKNNNPNIKQLADRVSDSIIEQIDNLTYIASEFSNFAKMPEARPEEIEIGELLNKAVELYCNTPFLNINVIQNPDKVYVFSDRSQLLRVFTNLLENAKQAIPQGRHGYIEVSVILDHGKVIVSIADNGEGITDEVGKRIFQPYFTTKSSGTGLGLAMTKKIIELWQGEIWYESKQNEGTTFFVKLTAVR